MPRRYIELYSFGYRWGDCSADVVYDARHVKNPHLTKHLRRLCGLDEEVQQDVIKRPRAREIISSAICRINNGASSVAIGCSFGKHRSVALVEVLAKQLRMEYKVGILHRDLA